MNKTRLLLYLTIGNLFAALLWNFPVKAWNLEDLTGSVRDGINSLAAGSSQAQTEPLPVPQAQPPIGNSASIQPCAAPPPVAASRTAPVQKALIEPEDRTIWLASRLKYPQSLKAIVDRFGTPSISTWDTPKSFTSYTTQTGRTITFEVRSSLNDPDVVTGYSLQ